MLPRQNAGCRSRRRSLVRMRRRRAELCLLRREHGHRMALQPCREPRQTHRCCPAGRAAAGRSIQIDLMVLVYPTRPDLSRQFTKLPQDAHNYAHRNPSPGHCRPDVRIHCRSAVGKRTVIFADQVGCNTACQLLRGYYLATGTRGGSRRRNNAAKSIPWGPAGRQAAFPAD